MVKIEQPHDVFIHFWLSWIKDYTPLPVLILYYSLCNIHFVGILISCIYMTYEYLYIYIYIYTYIYIYIYSYTYIPIFTYRYTYIYIYIYICMYVYIFI